MPMTVKQILVAARELISDEKHWCQGNYAQSESGKTCSFLSGSDKAASWCATGAIWQVTWSRLTESFNGNPVDEATSQLFKKTGAIPQFNDTHTHAEVLSAFDQAIAACK